MTLQQIAHLIPKEYRKEILDTNMIVKAQGMAGNRDMDYLFTIWKSYVEPEITPDCNLCFQRVLTNYKQLLPVLIDIEKSARTLNSL